MDDSVSQGRRHLQDAATINVILDKLDDFDVLLCPDNASRQIGWSGTMLPKSAELPFDERVVLYVISMDDVSTFASEHPHAMGLLVLDADEPFSASEAPLSPSLAKRIIAIRSKHPSSRQALLSHVISLTQLILFEIRMWTSDLDTVLIRKGSLQDIIDAREKVFGNYIDVNDSTYSLVAHTKGIEPIDTLSKNLIERGYHNIETVKAAESSGAFKEWREQEGINVYGPDDIVPCQYVTGVLRAGESYAGHVVMVCNNNPATPGLVDLFRKLCAVCQYVIDHTSFCEPPESIFVRKVLGNPRLTQSYIEEQCALLGIEPLGRFTLALVDYRNALYSEQPSWITAMLKKQFPHAVVFLEDGDLFLLMQTGKSTPPPQNVSTPEEIERFCANANCIAYLSDSFERLRDLRFAHRQAYLARTYKTCIDIELRPLDNIDSRRIFRFGQAFAYYCLDKHDADSEFWSVCLSHTVLDDILAADPGHSVSDIKILYFFLFNERKTTPTANQLNMHRNNVLYRIGSIEKRFGLDLDDYPTRQRLLNCYRFKILTSNKFRNLLSG